MQRWCKWCRDRQDASTAITFIEDEDISDNTGVIAVQALFRQEIPLVEFMSCEY